MIKKALLLLCALFLQVQAEAQTLLADSILIDGSYRHYLLYVPPAYTPGTPAPLVINMHGLGSNDTEQLYYSNLMPLADTAGFLIACPQGNLLFGIRYWNAGFGGTDDDVAFISNLIDSISAAYTVDAGRVYATGMSNGGYMSYFLACHLSSRIAAVASVTGSMLPGIPDGCTPGRAVPVMQIHGTADSTVPYFGGATSIAVDTLVQFWVNNNHCNPVPVMTPVPDLIPTDGSTAEHYVYNDGDQGSSVELYKIIGGGHTWPGSPFILGVTNQDFNASAEIWRFFSQYTLPPFLGLEPNATARAPLPAYPNPATEMIRIAAPMQGMATLYDISGRILLTTTTQQLNIRLLPKGVYLLQYRSGGKMITEKVVKQ